MELDKHYKVRVNPEQSRKIQELLFALGGCWLSGSYFKEPVMLDADCLFLNKLMVLTCARERGNCYFENKHTHTEIQADDLIALLADLSKSAENPLQNIEPTPEFGAVEPALADNCVNIQDIDTDILDTSVNHIEHGLVTIVMLQVYKGYDFVGYEYLENYHKDELSRFYPVENKPDPLIDKLRNKLNFYRDEFDKAATQDKKIEMQGRMAGISNAIAIVEIDRE